MELVERGLRGTYVSVEPLHFFRYLDEQVYRYNQRQKMTGSDRFELACAQIVGKRLAWDELTAKQKENSPVTN